MEEWRTYNWGDLITLEYGKPVPDKESVDGDIPVFGTNGQIGTSHLKPLCPYPSVIIGRKGAYRGVHYSDKPFSVIDTGFYMKPLVKDLNLKWVYYKFLTYDINRMDSGSAIPSTDRYELYKIPVNLPPIEEQNRIVSILDSIDNKIALNNRINHNLEEQAQALYKSWFVDFEPFKDGKFVESELGMIPEGWQILSLGDITSKFGTGLNPRKNFKLGQGTNFYVTIKNMGDNRIYLDERCDKVNDEAISIIQKRSKLAKGDLLFSGIGTIGRVAIITETPRNWNTSESIFNMHPIDSIAPELMYVLLLSDEFQSYVMRNAQGGVQQGIRMSSLKEYKLAIPSTETMDRFTELIVPIVSQIQENNNINDQLSSLRDSLLPRLMSGEITC